ncbi:tRNA (guanine-N(7)-)-methyltransferase [Prochlorococcus marinus str. NATL2A]|uniref:tRNA (guanine-N(7)-)-methyltransferase n=1 Tax=Prochlorococcus marinus (strain NATL2A) TaxID=59920 RepID=TRMB_PROMT|nr:tRNA (guanosine(46)-N7)-methyltransferase TrmB [Prochlorococcus marinus]Q46HD3.1 RecName: Full=tRNA (guanine-N(7)-)-methyltransferase; AltName: Full=tRNA (guanine(46)-N(7))-methyltransferase; AltName: Full=tRNA(m7G46)-methyltransferase [Prochlorococcus marinus str. NATL2A]AAZ59095.1 tRNA (guanine-N(7)-)-methyltransferase [Prochlorococcus marinus str. NATL2A]
MRQHVNPLSQFFQLPLSLPSKNILFEKSHYPIHLDIGSAKGEFLIELATKCPDWNFVGLEIREPLVSLCEKKRRKLELTNLKFLFCNVNVSLDEWLSDLDFGQLKRVSIQFPDPWFKRKHFKRRVLKTNILNSIAKAMSKNGEIFIQSDIFELIEYMTNTIDENRYFTRKNVGDLRSINKNPYNVMTDREILSLKKNLLIYRVMYIRNSLLFTN